jgi:putative membrane-bound dehydrogenase-like protein
MVGGLLRAAEPLSPEAALADFALPPGYRIELAAAEPQIVDPVAMAFDPQGRLWVVEMHDYPLLAEGAKPSSRIRILEDKNGDGFFETASTFADGLLFPTGLQLWGNGAFVTLAGELAYFPDENQDGRADRKETWFQGFATLNEQLRANHPTLAADGWIYVAGGLRGGQIKNLRRLADDLISINGRDFAFNPRTGECRAVSGNGQFGLTFDDFGRRFTCSNRNPLIEVMIEQRYLERNPKHILPRVVQDAAAAGTESRIYPRSRAITTSAQHSGQFTAACGVEIYRGDAMPAAWGNAFVCEPTANLVHREVVSSHGAAMRAAPSAQQAEFMSATDEWFRPVNLATGPDGALYVVDMYRAVIEHPEWMPPELRHRPDMLDGVDRGRIYRIVADAQPSDASDSKGLIAADDPEQLAALLSHANSWQRETAARRLLEISGEGVVAALKPVADGGKSAAARYLAYSLLESLDAMTPELAAQAMRYSESAVRALGLVLAESRLAESPALAEQVVEMAGDVDPRVRYQGALTSMFLPIDQAVPMLQTVAAGDAGDSWTCRAVALAARDQAGPFLASLLSRSPRVEFTPALAQELVAATVANDDQGLVSVLGALDRVDPATSRLLLLAANDALQQRGASLGETLASLAQRRPASNGAIGRLFDDSLAVLLNAGALEEQRIAEASLLRLDARPSTAEALLELLSGEAASPPVQTAAIAALSSQTDSAVADALLELFPDQLPTVRRASLDLLASRPAWRLKLLAAVASEQIAAGDVDPARRQQLMQDADPEIRKEAERLFAALMKDREEVLRRYQAALELTGNAERGHAVYAANCASCHRIGVEGTAVGPDIGDASMKTSAQLLTDILDPNRAVDANFVNYVALTFDGVGHQGIISSESETGLVLLGVDGKMITILRDDIESLTSGKSLMPEGLEQQINPQQMADLLAFLKTWRHAAELRAKRTDNNAKAASLP